jgi:hypothetical protein
MDKVFLFDGNTEAMQRAFAPLRPRVIRDKDDLVDILTNVPKVLLIADDNTALLRILATVRLKPRASADLLLLDSDGRAEFFEWLFRRVVIANPGFLPAEELGEVLASPERANLFIGGQVDVDAGALLLIRGDLSSVMVPLSMFRAAPDGPQPDPSRFSVTDHGQTIQLGDYESASDAILYEVDPEFRRALAKRRRAEEKTFGASLRRLRIQRGLRQGDFSGISEREIGRIERGEVEKPHQDTLRLIARRLGVRVEEIDEY